MDLLTLLFRLPFLPLRGFIRLAEIIRDEAEREWHDPSSIRRQLEEAEGAQAAGELSDEEVARLEGEVVGRVVAPAGNPPPGGAGSPSERS